MVLSKQHHQASLAPPRHRTRRGLLSCKLLKFVQAIVLDVWGFKAIRYRVFICIKKNHDIFFGSFIHGRSITVHVQLCTDSSNCTKKTTCSGVPIDISFLGGVTPSPHDKAWLRARNLEHERLATWKGLTLMTMAWLFADRYKLI